MPTPDWLNDMGNLGDVNLLGLEGSVRPHAIHFADPTTAAAMVAAGTDVKVYGENMTLLTVPQGPVLPQVPVNTVLPATTVREAPGIPVVGAQLLCDGGTWTGGSGNFLFQWTRDGTPIGAPEPNGLYTPVVADETHMIGCSVTTDNAGGTSLPAVSNTVGPIEPIAAAQADTVAAP